MVLGVSLSRVNRPGAVLAVFFALFFASAPLICLQLCHLRHREDATTLALTARPFTTPPVSAQGHSHGGAEPTAAQQPAPGTSSDPFLAEMQRLLQALVEGALISALVILPLAWRPARISPLPALVRAALEVRQPPPRASAGA